MLVLAVRARQLVFAALLSQLEYRPSKMSGPRGTVTAPIIFQSAMNLALRPSQDQMLTSTSLDRVCPKVSAKCVPASLLCDLRRLSARGRERDLNTVRTGFSYDYNS